MSGKKYYCLELAGYDIPPKPNNITSRDYAHQCEEMFHHSVKPLEELVTTLGGIIESTSYLAGVLVVSGLSEEKIAELQRSEYVATIKKAQQVVEE